MYRMFRGVVWCVALLLSVEMFATAQAPVLRKESLEIRTPQGVFRFRKLMVRLDGSAISISGTITNDTERNWRHASFDVALFDERGRQIPVRAGSPVVRYTSSGMRHAPSVTRNQLVELVIDDLPIGQTRYFHKEEIRVLRHVLPSDIAIAPDDSSQAEYQFVLVEPETALPWSYQDDVAEFVFNPSAARIGFSMENKTDAALMIDWENSAYVDPSGLSHRIIHNGIKLVERAQTEAPTKVPAGTKVEEFAYPADAVEWVENLRDWQEPGLFPATGYEGRNFSLSLRVVSGDHSKDYVFRFQID